MGQGPEVLKPSLSLALQLASRVTEDKCHSIARTKPTRGKEKRAPPWRASRAAHGRGFGSNSKTPSSPSLQGRHRRHGQCGIGAAIVAGTGSTRVKGTPPALVAGPTGPSGAVTKVAGIQPGAQGRRKGAAVGVPPLRRLPSPCNIYKAVMWVRPYIVCKWIM